MKKQVALLILFVMVISIAGQQSSVNAVAKEKNPYVVQYLLEQEEKGSVITEKDINDEMFQILEEYYREDKKVEKIIEKYSNSIQLTDLIFSIEKEGKIEVMHFLMSIYDDFNKNEKTIVNGYFERYAFCSYDEEATNFMKKIYGQNDTYDLKDSGITDGIKQDDNISIKTSGSYSGYTAATWARANYNQYSTNYPKLTEGDFSDCANFVSQAIEQGGKIQDSEWYCTKKNSTYLVPTTVAQLNYSWDLADPSPWTAVREFRSYWVENCDTSTIYSCSYYNNNHNVVYSLPWYKGDVLILHTGIYGFVTIPKHAMMITGYDSVNKDYLYSSHSSERLDKELLFATASAQGYAAVEFIAID